MLEALWRAVPGAVSEVEVSRQQVASGSSGGPH